jgi:hypothetical protein
LSVPDEGYSRLSHLSILSVPDEGYSRLSHLSILSVPDAQNRNIGKPNNL